MLDVRLQLMWVLVLYTGHFTLHAFSALVSFCSDDLNPRRANSQFASSLHGCQTRVIIYHLFVAAVLILSSICHEEQIRSSQAVHMDGRHERRL